MLREFEELQDGAGTDPAHETELDRDNNEDDPWNGIGGFPPPLEKLLISIIRAHPRKDDDTPARLKIAMEVLVDREPALNKLAGSRIGQLTGMDSSGTKQDQDLSALEWMHTQRAKDERRYKAWLRDRRLGLKPSKRSIRALAREAADKFFPSNNPSIAHSTMERLRNKFSGHRGSKSRQKKSIPYKISSEYDYVRETVEAQSLDRVCVELERWGVMTDRYWR